MCIRDRIWAEAVSAYQAGEASYTHAEDEGYIANLVQSHRYSDQSAEDVIDEFLNSRTQPFTMNTLMRQLKLNDVKAASHRVGSILRGRGYEKQSMSYVQDGKQVKLKAWALPNQHFKVEPQAIKAEEQGGETADGAPF